LALGEQRTGYATVRALFDRPFGQFRTYSFDYLIRRQQTQSANETMQLALARNRGTEHLIDINVDTTDDQH
jgi:hypothetical protein